MTVGEATRRPRDLDTRGQIHDLVIQFYREIMLDPLLGPVFDEVAEVEWRLHIPRLIDFWCRFSASPILSTTKCGMPPLIWPASSMKRGSKPVCFAFHDR